MAGDWIPFRKDLDQQIEVFGICARTGLSVADVVFRLLKLWSWADTVTSDGWVREAVGVVSQLSHHCPLLDQRFLEAVAAVGWLRFDGDRFEFPNFDRWMGNSAKKRLMGTIRRRNNRLIQKAREIIDASSKAEMSELSRGCPTFVPPTVQNSTDTLSPLPSPSPGAVESVGVVSPPAGQTEREKKEPEKTGPSQPAPTAPANLRAMPCDHPEAAAAAKRVVQHYQRVVRPGHPPGGGVESALNLLVAGQTEERLREAVNRYAAWCARHRREPQFREAAKTFFGETGQCGAFLEDDPEVAEQTAQAPPIHRAKPREKTAQPAVSLRELMERSKASRPEPANPVAQIEQEARSANKTTPGQSGDKEASNGR